MTLDPSKRRSFDLKSVCAEGVFGVPIGYRIRPRSFDGGEAGSSFQRKRE